jgi:hypothetical protein
VYVTDAPGVAGRVPPDGSDWHVISIVTLRDGKIARQVAFFAPCYAVPEWRAQWVESMD